MVNQNIDIRLLSSVFFNVSCFILENYYHSHSMFLKKLMIKSKILLFRTKQGLIKK